nr:7TM GPCR domain containing protein [Haemonchus contortus]
MVDIVNGSRSDEVIAGTIVLTVGITGISLNIAAILLIYRTPSLHNAFGFICSSHLLSNIGLLVVFSFWTAPMLLIGCSESITQSYIGQRMGQLVVLFWFATIYGHLQIALNRLVAIISPLLYSSTFTRIRTIQILVIFWFISFMQVAGQFFRVRLKYCAALDDSNGRPNNHEAIWLHPWEADICCPIRKAAYREW